MYVAFVLGIGLIVKSSMKTCKDFFEAGGAMPSWVSGLAMLAVSLSAPVVIGVGGWGAQYGLEAAHIFGIGAIPALLFAGLMMMPLYYGSKARSVPEFLFLRFDAKTRVLSACLFLVMTVFSSGIGMYAIGRAATELHLFDRFFLQVGWPRASIFPVTVSLVSIVVAAYVLLGGLVSAIYNQVLQFFVILAGLLPVVFLGLKNIGGWQGLKAAAPGAHGWQGLMHPSTNPMGIEIAGLGMGMGFVLGAGYWCTNVIVVQNAMASKDAASARRAPLIAAAAAVLLPFILVLPGLLAIGLPTPHSTTTVTMGADGSIVHNIQVVSAEAEQGKGVVPARVDPVSGRPLLDGNGRALLDYDMATPNLLFHFLPAGSLGLGLAALLAAFMCGVSGSITALNAVFTCDIYQPHIRKSAGDRHYIAVGRITTVVGILLSIAAACSLPHFGSVMSTLQLLFSVVTAPLLATLLLGMFWKRATGHGAFIGLVAGVGAALLHHGATRSMDASSWLQGGWITVFHKYPSAIAQSLYGAIFAFGVSLILTVLISLVTEPKAEAELVGLVRALTPRPAALPAAWWKRPEAVAAFILLAALIVNLLIA